MLTDGPLSVNNCEWLNFLVQFQLRTVQLNCTRTYVVLKIISGS